MAVIDRDGARAQGADHFVPLLAERALAVLGDDLDLSPHTREAQLIGVFAAMLADASTRVVGLYEAMGIHTATGAALDALVALNGTHRRGAQATRASVEFEGVAGQDVPAGTRLRSTAGHVFTTDAETSLLQAGAIATASVGVTAERTGAIEAPANTITELVSAVPNIFQVTNGLAATPGFDVESDTALRRRYFQVLGYNALSSLASLEAAVLAVDGVTHAIARDNPRDAARTVQGIVIPAHSIVVVVAGGTNEAVGLAIAEAKPAGVPVTGDTAVNVAPLGGLTETVRFQRMTNINLQVNLSIRTTQGVFPGDGSTRVAEAVVAYLSDIAPATTPNDQRVRAAAIGAAPGFTIASLTYENADTDTAIPSTLSLSERLVASVDRVEMTVTTA